MKPNTGTLVTRAGDLKSALSVVRPAIAARATIPILSAVMLDGCRVVATDLDTRLSSTFAGESSKFKACLDFSVLSRLVAATPDDDEITLWIRDLDGNSVDFVCDGARYTLRGLSPADFPNEISGAEGEPDLVINSDNVRLADAFRRVRYAVSTEETRYYLNGVAIVPVDQAEGEPRAAVVATDGHRLALRYVDGLPSAANLIIPTRAVDALINIGNPTKTEVFDCAIRFTWPGVTLTSCLIDGTYPAVGKVLPNPDKAKATFGLPVKGVASAIRRLSATATGRRRCRVLLYAGPEGLCLSTNAPESASRAAEMVEGFDVFKGSAESAFNASYLRDALKVADGDILPVSFYSDAEPIGIFQGDCVDVVMPLRESGSAREMLSHFEREE